MVYSRTLEISRDTPFVSREGFASEQQNVQ